MATLIRPDGTQTEVQPANGKSFKLKEVYELLGRGCSFVEHINLEDGRLMLFDERGKFDQHPLNEAATRHLIMAGGMPNDFVAGSVLLVNRKEFR